MGINKLSYVALFDALSQGDDRFNSIRNLIFTGKNIEDAILSSDKYSVELLARYNKRDVVVKILLDMSSERCQDIMQSLEKIENIKIPIFSNVEIFKSELLVINGENSAINCDIILIGYSDLSIFDGIQANYKGVLSSFISICTELLSRNIILDLLPIESFYYNRKTGAIISSTCSFLIKTPSGCENIAFKNYLIAQLLRIILFSLNKTISKDEPESDILESYCNERFDLRKLDYFLSSNYKSKITDMLILIGSKSDIDYNLFNKAIESDRISDTISTISLFTDDINYSYSKKSKYIGNRDFDIIGEHHENRLAIRDNINDKFGYLDFEENLVIDYLYDEVTDFNEDIAVCRIGEQYGAINRDGENILDFKYDLLEWDCIRNTFVWEIGNDKGQIKRKDIIK